MKTKLYMGIDLEHDRAMVSVYHDGMAEMETISTAAGETRYPIPDSIYINKNGKCYYGEEARKRRDYPEGEFYEQIYRNALSETEDVYLYRGLLVQYLQRLIRLGDGFTEGEKEVGLVITVDRITDQVVNLFQYVREQMLAQNQDFLLIDHAESFFYHTYHQENSIWVHDAAMFDFSEEKVRFCLLHRNGNSKVLWVISEEKSWNVTTAVWNNPEMKDEFFANIIRESFMKRIISALYFIGDGFDGDWLKESIRVIGPNKRVFLGKNLYTRGACYGAYRQDHMEQWPFVFNCAYKMQGEVSLNLLKQQKRDSEVLIPAGENWYDCMGEALLLYNGTPELEFSVRKPNQLGARIVKFALDQLPERPSKTIRLRVLCVPVSGSCVNVKVVDDGFGEIYEPSGKEWNYSIDIL